MQALEHEIKELIISSLSLEDITPEDIDPTAPLFVEGLGLDSIDALELALAISKRYGFQLRSDNDENHRIFASLRALSAHRAYHWAYGGDITAGRVADFLILNGESPRSLITSLYEAVWNLEGLAKRYGDTVPTQARDKAREVLGRLQAHDIDMIFDEGLHEFLTWFITEIGTISSLVHEDYLLGGS